MTRFFGISIDTLMPILLIVTCVIMAGALLLAVSNAIFFKIGTRNASRRRAQMVLIVFALMLSTTLLSSVLATGDVLTSAVQSVAVYNWGNIDELVQGGHGPLGTYSEGIYHRLQQRAQGAPNIVAVGAALNVSNLLLADQTSRQVRAGVGALAILPGSEMGFGGVTDATTKLIRPISLLRNNQVYLNQTSAILLNAHSGDRLYVYSSRWPGRRYTMQVMAIVSNTNVVGDQPTIVSNLSTFQTIENKKGFINQILIANRGGGISGVGLSTQVSDQLRQWLPDEVHVIQVKEQGVQDAQLAQEIFSRIFSLFALFSLAIGLLLIFLIFVLLAAERRAEMGIARAVGVQRGHLIMMYLFEGVVYDLLASMIGLFAGFGLGFALVYILQPVLARFNFPLKFSFQPHSLIVAYCLGVIFTFGSIAISAWLVSRMTIIEAIRDLPEPTFTHLSLREQWIRFSQLVLQLLLCLKPQTRNWRRGRRILFEHIPEAVLSFLITMTVSGIVPLCVGVLLVYIGLHGLVIIPFSLGLSLFIFGAILLLKTIALQCVTLIMQLRYRQQWTDDFRGWSGAIDGAIAAVVGLTLAAYWGLPFDVLVWLGLPRFQGGIEVFFVAGLMMVLGTSWACIANGRLLTAPFLLLCTRMPRVYILARLALAYPLQRRFRTGLSVVMFSLVVFAMTVMVIITNATQNSYVNIATQTGGYDIQATAFFKPIPDLQTSLAQHGIDPDSFSAIGTTRTTAVGLIQPNAPSPRWSTYPAQIISGGFFQGYGTHLTARAKGFTSDASVWQAMQKHPNYVLIDSNVLRDDINNAGVYDPSAHRANFSAFPGIDPQYAFTLSGVSQNATTFPAVPLWVVGLQGKVATKVTVIGIVGNSDAAHYGLYVSKAAYSAKNIGIVPGSSHDPQSESYYFKVAPGQDAHTLSLKLGSAYLDDGLETTALADIIWQARGPRILLSDVLLAVVGLTLLLGVAALALTGTRAVIERRQQIGMLRAMGSPRSLIQCAFLLESFLIGTAGSLLGITLGLLLARNIFAANFFEQYQTGLAFSIPYPQLALIVAISLLASFLGAILPAWQAGRVAPAEALRYT